jgi:cytochrome P450
MIDTKKFQHAPKRRAISQALHGKSVKQIEEAVSKNVHKFCSILQGDNGGDWSSSVNMSEVTSYLSFDIMGEVCFGQTFGMQEHTENRYIVDIVSTGAQCLNTVTHSSKPDFHALILK